MTAYLNYHTGTEPRTAACENLLTIGRDRSNDIVLPDLLVSRYHAMVRRLAGRRYYFIDSGSSNGSFVNGQRVRMPVLLNKGDEIRIGNAVLVFDQDASRGEFTDSISLQDTLIHEGTSIREITVLVADMRDFTALSETMPIRTLTKMMNKWFSEAAEVIDRNRGTVDKFLGDAVFARWETHAKPQQVVLSALRTAWELHLATERVGAEVGGLMHKLRIGVGINTGTASVGIGQDDTALGDAVNTAFRLESATKALGKDVALSRVSYKHLPEKFWKHRERYVELKGKKQPQRVRALSFAQVHAILRELHHA